MPEGSTVQACLDGGERLVEVGVIDRLIVTPNVPDAMTARGQIMREADSEKLASCSLLNGASR
jgi:hypothetical protein